MFEIIATIREALEVRPVVFVLISGCLGFVLFAALGWAIDRSYQRRTHPPSTSPGQAAGSPQNPAPHPEDARVPRPDQTEPPGKRESDRVKAQDRAKNNLASNRAVHQESVGANSPNVNIEQRTEGANSPIIDSPITVNPEVNAYAPVIIYDFRGNKKIIADGGTRGKAVFGDQQLNFERIIQLHDSKNWAELRDFCEKQMEATPEWLTPYLFGGIAHANLGNSSRAIELLSFVERKSAGNPDYQDAGRILKLLQQPPKS